MKVKTLENIHQLAVRVCKIKSPSGLRKLIQELEGQFNRRIEVKDSLWRNSELDELKNFLLFDVIYREQVNIYKFKTLSPKKSGRKSDKISRAFSAITSRKVPFSEHARKYDVSENVLMQPSRFDVGNEGKVRTKTIDGVKMIWREK